jgi:hypothetical protein
MIMAGRCEVARRPNSEPLEVTVAELLVDFITSLDGYASGGD